MLYKTLHFFVTSELNWTASWTGREIVIEFSMIVYIWQTISSAIDTQIPIVLLLFIYFYLCIYFSLSFLGGQRSRKGIAEKRQ